MRFLITVIAISSQVECINHKIVDNKFNANVLRLCAALSRQMNEFAFKVYISDKMDKN